MNLRVNFYIVFTSVLSCLLHKNIQQKYVGSAVQNTSSYRKPVFIFAIPVHSPNNFWNVHQQRNVCTGKFWAKSGLEVIRL